MSSNYLDNYDLNPSFRKWLETVIFTEPPAYERGTYVERAAFNVGSFDWESEE